LFSSIFFSFRFLHQSVWSCIYVYLTFYGEPREWSTFLPWFGRTKSQMLAHSELFQVRLSDNTKVNTASTRSKCIKFTFYLIILISDLHPCRLYQYGDIGWNHQTIEHWYTVIMSIYITTKVQSSKPVHGEVYSIQYYVIKFISDLRQVGGFLWVHHFLLQ